MRWASSSIASCVCVKCTAPMCSSDAGKRIRAFVRRVRRLARSRYRRHATTRPSPSAYRAADCVPILLADRRTGAVAAIHAGWKGTAAGAAMVAVQSLTSRYGTNPEDVDRGRGSEHRAMLLRGWSRSRRHIFPSHAEASQWFTQDAKPHLDLVARHARPARARGSSAAADSRVRAVHLRPSRAVPFLPARWQECGQARGCD